MFDNDEIINFNKFLSKDPTPGIRDRLSLEDKFYKLPGWVFDISEKQIQIPYKTLNRKLVSLGYSGQIAYDILVNGIVDINDRPRCPVCGKFVKFEGLSRGYYKTCGNAFCISNNIGYFVSNLWKDENYRDLQITSHKLWASKKENLEQMSKISSEKWKDENYRDLQITSHKLWASKKENLEQMSKITTLLWKNEEYRNKQVKSHIEYAKNNPEKIKRGISGKVFSDKSSSSYIEFDSSWEREFILTVNDMLDVVSIERAHFSIPYSVGNSNHLYFPDFKIVFNTGKRLLVEIKAQWMIDYDEKTSYKIEAGYKYVEESNDFDEYLLLVDKHFYDLSQCVNINRDLIKKELLKHKN